MMGKRNKDSSTSRYKTIEEETIERSATTAEAMDTWERLQLSSKGEQKQAIEDDAAQVP